MVCNKVKQESPKALHKIHKKGFSKRFQNGKKIVKKWDIGITSPREFSDKCLIDSFRLPLDTYRQTPVCGCPCVHIYVYICICMDVYVCVFGLHMCFYIHGTYLYITYSYTYTAGVK